ncbi:MAG: hypothetical protein J5854_08160 [Clostridia bacterium]|nr:hypothetical protein [Clostridia bacterium]
MSAMTLIIITPEGEKLRVPCDSVTVSARDGLGGEGGGVGIRRGHIEAVIALSESSPVTACEDGKCVLRLIASGGFLRVKNDELTLVAESVTEPGGK